MGPTTLTFLVDEGDEERSFQARLELLSNLIYLAKRVTPGSQLQHGYLDRAEEVLSQAGKGPK
jgi:hypothetical protein